MVEFELINVFIRNDRVIVEVSIADSIDSFSFPKGYDQNHRLSNEPQFLSPLKEILERRYDPAKRIKTEPLHIKSMLKKRYNTADIIDVSPKKRNQQMKDRHLQYVHINPAKSEEEEYRRIHGHGPIPKKEPKIIKPVVVVKIKGDK